MKKSFPHHWFLILVPFLSGCQDKQVVSYEVPKESHDAPASVAPAMSGPSELAWEKPENWLEKPASAFRKGSYAAGEASSGEVDISISTFPDSAGGLLANLNRWRGQVSLDAIGDAELSSETAPVQIAGIPGIRVDFSEALSSDGDPAASKRIVGAVVTMGGSAWFFKMSGPNAAVDREIPSFDALLQSVRPAAVSTPSIPSMPPAGVGGAMATQTDAIPAPPAPDPFRFEAPQNWVRQPPAPMRVASFLISGESVPDADLSVIALPGTAGGDLANVNRWRGQISLPPITQDQLTSAAQHIDSGDYHFDLYDMVSDAEILEGGHRARILAAIFIQGNTSWFFKVTGEDQLVSGEKASFIGFLKSFRLEEEK